MARELKVEIVGDATSYTRSLRKAEAGTTRFNREISRTTRGVAAGSGAFKSLGRSIAFASGGFIAAAGITDVLRGSIEQASQAEAVQRQLAAQFKASGQNLGLYQRQIDAATASISRLAGIEDDELKAAFVTAFRGSNNVAVALKIQAVAADVARGRHIDLSTAVIALTKAYGGQTTALRRLGIQVPTALHGIDALTFVSRRFAGQAKAGTTSQQRFTAAFKNMEEVLGKQLLPTIERITDAMTKWLANPENQKKVQDATKNTATAVGRLTTIFFGAVHAADVVGTAFDTQADHVKQLAKAFLLLGDAAQKSGEDVRNAALSGAAFRPRTSEDVAAAGAARRTAVPTAAGAPGALGFNVRFARLGLALARAELTQTQQDNRAILVQQAALVRERLTKVKSLKDRTDLYQQLGGIEAQIQGIDDQARQQELDARQKAVDKAKAHAAKLKAQAAAVKAQLQSALDSAITQMGQLFEVFVPDDPAKGILGVVGGGVSAKSLTAKLKAQTDQVVAFNRDLNRLAKRGAPPALIAALRAEGLPGAQNVHALATAGRADLNTFLRQYARRQRVAQQIAHADIRAKNVYINGNIRRTATTPTSQRRGRNAGVIDAAMLAGAGSPWS